MKNYILFVLIIIVAGLAVTAGLTLPRYDDLAWARQQLNFYQDQLESEEARFSELDTVRRRIEQQQAALDKISSSLPFYPDAPSVVVFLREKARENGLMMVGSPMMSTDYYPWGGGSTGIRPLKVGLVLAGPYDSLRGFIRSVEASSRLIRVDSVSVQEGEDGRLRHRLDFEAFFYQN